ncbi:MAG: outer membrane protein assembly factor BamA [Bryobacteraceae bacterium]|nr:outer membrane protein assembly factor BamA [Bryobacteraceae bacterium]
MRAAAQEASNETSVQQAPPAGEESPASGQGAAQPEPDPEKPKPASPFETPQPAQQPASPFETPQPSQEPKPPSPFETPPPTEAPPEQMQDVIEAIEFRGARRVPQDTLRAMTFSKKGDKYDPEALHRDFMALWNSGRFDDITLEKEQGKYGWIVRFRVIERRVVRSIKYEGNKSIQISEILDKFKERRVGLAVETQYDPNKIQAAVVVLKEFLSERGRQFATVSPQIRQIPPSSLEVTFKINEGPKVKVGDIDVEGNTVFSDKAVIRAMNNLRPIGVPHSLLFESLFSKAFDSTKLEEDKERIRNFYQERGYFTARAIDHDVAMRDVGGGGFKIPLFYPNKPGKRADITVKLEEGRLYRLNQIRFEGVKLFRTPETLMRPLFKMEKGDVFSTKHLRDGLKNMTKLYGEFGYIDFVPEPYPEPVPGTDLIDLNMAVEEGKQFFVRRIDFSGNTTTRDKVIRRELLIDEGDMFNTRLWEVSLLRLNQLGYFEVLKEEEAADIRRDTRTSTVDITLKVKERGKNSVQMTGGVSGIAGTFLGFGYATNNFLGLGETLSLDAQVGSRLRNVTFGFTEPYLFDRPIQAGFTVYTTRFNFDQAREWSIWTGRNLLPLFETYGSQNLLNYVSQGYGFTTFASYPLRRSFARLSLTYGFDRQNIQTLSEASTIYFQYLNFQGLDGPNSLSGIRTSRVVPGYHYNTVDHPITPSRGRELFISTSFAGVGGNVKMISPTVDFKLFRRAWKPGHVWGVHLLGRSVTGYGGVSAPPFNRFYMGGENDIRGFEIWSVSPVAFVASTASVPVYNSDGSARTQRTIVDGEVQFAPVFQRIPNYQMIFPGGDLQGVANTEYRIPIVGPLTLALFFDAGINKVIFPNQLRLNPGRLAELNGTFPQAAFDGRAVINNATQQLRTSTGVEFQIMMPVVNAPFRLYWAYNPTLVRTFLQPPVVADRSYFPNQTTFVNSLLHYGQAYPWFEQRRTFRFTISRTF